jgi:hypothetical protein
MDESAHLRSLITQLHTLGAYTGESTKKKSKNSSGSKHNERQTRENKPHSSAWNTNREPSADTIKREWNAFDPHAHIPFPPLKPQKPKKFNRETDEERRAMKRATTFEENLYDKHLHEERIAAFQRRQDEEDEHYYASHARSGAAAGPRRH